jgi:hypothetical protein
MTFVHRFDPLCHVSFIVKTRRKRRGRPPATTAPTLQGFENELQDFE